MSGQDVDPIVTRPITSVVFRMTLAEMQAAATAVGSLADNEDDQGAVEGTMADLVRMTLVFFDQCVADVELLANKRATEALAGPLSITMPIIYFGIMIEACEIYCRDADVCFEDWEPKRAFWERLAALPPFIVEG
jgi:hypothetical protein